MGQRAPCKRKLLERYSKRLSANVAVATSALRARSSSTGGTPSEDSGAAVVGNYFLGVDFSGASDAGRKIWVAEGRRSETETGALDVESDEGAFTVSTEVTDFNAVQDGLREKGIEWEEAELAMIPKTEIKVEGADAEQLVKLLELLEELDDVQKVYTNADVDTDSLAEV